MNVGKSEQKVGRSEIMWAWEAEQTFVIYSKFKGKLLEVLKMRIFIMQSMFYYYPDQSLYNELKRLKSGW